MLLSKCNEISTFADDKKLKKNEFNNIYRSVSKKYKLTGTTSATKNYY